MWRLQDVAGHRHPSPQHALQGRRRLRELSGFGEACRFEQFGGKGEVHDCSFLSGGTPVGIPVRNRIGFRRQQIQSGRAARLDPLWGDAHGHRQRVRSASGQLKEAGAGLRSLGEPCADTLSPAGRMVLTVFAGIAEFERALIQQRTSSGRVAAMQRGVRFGRPAKLEADQVALAQRLMGEGTPVRAIARMLNVHPATVYRAIAASSDDAGRLVRA